MGEDAANIYDIGDGIDLFGDFSRDDQPIDPTTVVCRVREPRSDAPITVAATKVGVVTVEGKTYMRYTAEVITDIAGDWYYRFEGTGAVTATAEKRFSVRASKVL